jgi:hypothetical protein
MHLRMLLLAVVALSLAAHASEPGPIRSAQAPDAGRTPPPGPSKAIAQQLNGLLVAKDYAKLTDALNRTPPLDRMAWLQSRLHAGESAFVGYALLRDLWSVAQLKRFKDADTAMGVVALYVYQLILIDGAMCADASAPGHRHVQFLTTYRPIFQSLKALPAEEKSKIIRLSLEAERRTRLSRSFRKGDDFLCRGGMDEMTAALERFPRGVTAGELAEKYGKKSKSGVGIDVELPPAKAYVPKFLPYEAYAPAQSKLRLSMVGMLVDLLK